MGELADGAKSQDERSVAPTHTTSGTCVRGARGRLADVACLFTEGRVSGRIQARLADEGARLTRVPAGEALRRALATSDFDVLVLGSAPVRAEEVELAREVLAAWPTGVVLVADGLDKWTEIDLKVRGAVVLEEAELEGGLVALTSVARNRARRLRSGLRVGSRDSDRVEAFAARHRLTERQRDVLRRLIAGRTPKEIAAELGISHVTVKRHFQELYRRCGVDSARDLLALLAREAMALETHFARRG